MLVEITEQTHPILLDLRYASKNNFTLAPIYRKPLCLLHVDALPLLEKAIKIANYHNWKLKIFDAFRPTQAVQKMWDFCPNPQYLSNPNNGGSHHSRGVAIDLTLVNSNNQELDMGTGFDTMESKSHLDTIEISPAALSNRYTLLGIMLSAGWDFFMNEWWHFQVFNPRNYPIIDNDHGIM
jgi:D-alanyl-D-alanine dipeptidase